MEVSDFRQLSVAQMSPVMYHNEHPTTYFLHCLFFASVEMSAFFPFFHVLFCSARADEFKQQSIS